MGETGVQSQSSPQIWAVVWASDSVERWDGCWQPWRVEAMPLAHMVLASAQVWNTKFVPERDTSSVPGWAKHFQSSAGYRPPVKEYQGSPPRELPGEECHGMERRMGWRGWDGMPKEGFDLLGHFTWGPSVTVLYMWMCWYFLSATLCFFYPFSLRFLWNCSH